MEKHVDREPIRRAGAELRALTDRHPALQHPAVQELLQAWVDAQRNDASPEQLCGRLAKTIVELAALFQAEHVGISDEEIQTTLRSSIALWEKRSLDGDAGSSRGVL